MKRLSVMTCLLALVMLTLPSGVETRQGGGSTSNDTHDQIHAMTSTPTFTAVQSGNWSDLATWGGTSGGGTPVLNGRSVLTSGATTANNSSYSTDVITPSANRLLVALSVSSRNNTTINVPTASGNGLAWERVASADAFLDPGEGNRRRLAAFVALTGASPAPGSITFDYAGQDQTGSGWAIYEVDGDFAGALSPLAAVAQAASAVNASGSADPFVALGSASQSGNLLISSSGISNALLAENVAQRAGWSEEALATWTMPNTTVYSQSVFASDTAASASLASAEQWAINVLEIQSVPVAGGGGSGTLPGEFDRVAIPDGVTVTFDLPSSPCFDWIRVDHQATLRFATGTPTELRVKSLYAQGTYEQGTVASPITSTSRLTICGSDGTFDHVYDPLELSQGLIAMKPASIVGLEKTPFVSFSVAAAAGATQITLDENPSNWQAGDLALVVGQEKDNDEVRNIVSVDGNILTLSSPLTLDKTPGAESWMKLYVANLSRNVKITSEYEGATNLRKQGHVMLMAGGNTVKYADITRMGRTNQTAPTDPIFIDGVRNPQLFPLCVPNNELENGVMLENVRGRYPLHFHKAGPQSAKSIVEGVVVRGDRSEGDKFTSERWGIAVHSSHADVKKSIVYDIDGSQFVTEEGDEIGVFEDNLAVRSYGNNSPFAGQPSNLTCMNDNYPEIVARRRNTMGHTGNGFWVQGGGTPLIRNIAQGQTQGLNINTSDNAQNADPQYQQPVHLLLADWWGVADYGLAWAGNDTELGVTDVPTRILDNYIFGGRRLSNQKDAAVFYNVHQLNSMITYPGIPDSEHRGTRAWNVRRGMESEYTAQLNLQDIIFVAGVYSSNPSSEAIAIGAQNGRQHTLTNVRADGFADSVFKLGGASSRCFNSTTNGQNATARIDGVNVPCQIQ